MRVLVLVAVGVWPRPRGLAYYLLPITITYYLLPISRLPLA